MSKTLFVSSVSVVVGLAFAQAIQAGPTREQKIHDLIPSPPKTLEEARKRFGVVMGESGDKKTEAALKALVGWSDEISSQSKQSGAQSQSLNEAKISSEIMKVYLDMNSTLRGERDKFDFINNAALAELKTGPKTDELKSAYLRKVSSIYPAYAKKVKTTLLNARKRLDALTRPLQGKKPPLVERQLRLVESGEITTLSKLISINKAAVLQTGESPKP